MAHACVRIASLAVALTLALSATPGRAQTTTAEGFSASITPYLWIAGVSGTLQTRYQRVPDQSVSADFGDVLSNLSGIGFMGAAELRYGRFGLLGDVLTLTITSDVSTPRDLAFSGGSARLSTTMGSLIPTYRVIDDGTHVLDLGAGIRGWSIRTRLSLDAGLLAARTLKPSTSWIDPLIAARYTYRVNDSWSATLYGDVGGFGAGSELTWQLLGTVNYRFNSWLDVRAGYRHLAVERRRAGTELDIGLSGPILGATIRF